MQTITTLYSNLGEAIRFWKAELNKNSVSLTWGLAGKVTGQRNNFFDVPEQASIYLQKAISKVQSRYNYKPDTTALLLGIKLPKELRDCTMMDKDLMKYIFPIYCEVEDMLCLNANGTTADLKITDGVFWMPLQVINKEFLLKEINSLQQDYKKKFIIW
jgi:predicted DNA-binding WGR domain protein